VDLRFELGEIARNNQIPLLFERIKDYPGQRIFTNGMSSISSMALALGLGPGKRWRAFITEARRKAATPIRPLVVDKGPVLENVVRAPEINFLDFPIPQWSNHDGGRYIGTWHINVSRDLETGSRNLGVYRMEVLGPNQATVSTSPNSHLARHVAKAEKAGRPLEMAVAIGTSEAVVMAASAGCPYGMDEYELAGGLQGEGIRLVRGGTVNLEVPADSEIVIEGLIKPGVRVQDGPYFDYVGTANTSFNAFLFEATRLMFRSSPIFRGTAVGRPGAEDQQVFSVLSELGLFDFHGSRPKHLIQAQLIKRRFFRAFQLVGRIGWKGLVSRKKSFPPRVRSQAQLPTMERETTPDPRHTRVERK
jgi:4-hydroxy-3-polyprenylbenzoate decarboxylase